MNTAQVVDRRPVMAPKVFSSVSTYYLGSVAGKDTAQCCVGELWYYRATGFVNWLPANQPNTEAGMVTSLASEAPWTLIESAVSVLNVSHDTSDVMLAKLLKERGHTGTLAQVEELAKAAERGERTGMVKGDRPNFFFLDNEDGTVSVARIVHTGCRQWVAFIYALSATCRWGAGSRLFVWNFDQPNLI